MSMPAGQMMGAPQGGAPCPNCGGDTAGEAACPEFGMPVGGGQPPMGGPPGPGGGMAPNLLPFASTQPGGIEQLAGPLLQQQQIDLEAFKKQQLEGVMAVVMQHMAQQPNPLAQAAQTEPSPPMDGQPGSPADDLPTGAPPASYGTGGY